MEIIRDIPVELGEAALSSRLKAVPGRGRPEPWRPLVSRARRLVKPRALLASATPSVKGNGQVELDGVVLSSPLLSRSLAGIGLAFPYVLTIGAELENAASSVGDLLDQYYLEEIGNLALESAMDWLRNHLGAAFRLDHVAELSPGSLPDWPLSQQAKLFLIFRGRERAIGVRLTESSLMIPRKSISGILFPSADRFVACQLCHRENCQGRKAPLIIPDPEVK